MTPRFSVLMPAYQAAATIDEAIASVLGQTVEDWELIVVDDGSTDATAERLAEWRRRDDRIHVFHHPARANLGRPATRNLTVREARGAIAAFLDADDLLEPPALERHGAALAVGDAAVSYGCATVRGGRLDGNVIGRGVEGRTVGLLEQLARFNVLVTSATAVRRAALGEAPFPLDMPLCQDWACWVQLARRQRFLHTADRLAVYRDHEGGGTSATVRREGEVAYELLQARFLRRCLADATPEERRALTSGLRFRATGCLLRALAAMRRGRVGAGRRWLRAAASIAGGPSTLLRSLASAPVEQLRIWRGEDPDLRLDRA